MFIAIWCVGVLTAAVTIAVKGSPAAIIPVIMFAFGVTIGIRTFRMSVAFDADTFVVRNFFRTRSMRRDEIEGFRSGSMSNQPFGRTIYALLGNGSVFRWTWLAVPIDSGVVGASSRSARPCCRLG